MSPQDAKIESLLNKGYVEVPNVFNPAVRLFEQKIGKYTFLVKVSKTGAVISIS